MSTLTAKVVLVTLLHDQVYCQGGYLNAVVDKNMRLHTAGALIALAPVLAQGAAAETRTITNGLEVHETSLILGAESPTHILTNARCADAQPGWKIVAGSVKAEVVTARMMDPGGDPDWKVEKAEARTKVDSEGKRICLQGYCQGPVQFQCEILVRASWQEMR